MPTPKTVDVTELILRDAHQSLMATRMATEDMLPACEDLDGAGFWSLECWGGATYDACIRFLNEDPWERLRELRNCPAGMETRTAIKAGSEVSRLTVVFDAPNRMAKAALNVAALAGLG